MPDDDEERVEVTGAKLVDGRAGREPTGVGEVVFGEPSAVRTRARWRAARVAGPEVHALAREVGDGV